MFVVWTAARHLPPSHRRLAAPALHVHHLRFVLLLITLVVLLVGAAAASTQLAWSYGLGWWLVPVAVATAVLATLLSRTGNAMYAHVLGAR